LFAEGKRANFDLFVCKDGSSALPAMGYSNYFGVEKTKKASTPAVTSTSKHGGWFMISGVELGNDKNAATQVSIQASANTGGKLEIWLDDLKYGQLIATIPVSAAKGANEWKTFSSKIPKVAGRHDVFVKFQGKPREIYVNSISFK
jgi:hypothetical protein